MISLPVFVANAAFAGLPAQSGRLTAEFFCKDESAVRAWIADNWLTLIALAVGIYAAGVSSFNTYLNLREKTPEAEDQAGLDPHQNEIRQKDF